MKKTAWVLLLISLTVLAEEPGGYDPENYTGGGYDPVEGERKAREEQAIRDAQASKSASELQSNMRDIAKDRIRKMDKADICALYGKAIRGDAFTNQWLSFDGAQQLIVSEAKKRKIKLNTALVKQGSIMLGNNLCQMYAAWGLPSDRNRSVGRYGEHIQHIYGGTYVYTENGVITSWQD